MEHFFSLNSAGEDQKKKKKVFTKKGTLFFPEFKWTPTLRCTPESIYWEGCRCIPYSTQTTDGDTAKLLGEYILPSPPGFGTPVGSERLLGAYC